VEPYLAALFLITSCYAGGRGKGCNSIRAFSSLIGRCLLKLIAYLLSLLLSPFLTFLYSLASYRNAVLYEASYLKTASHLYCY
jgi:hypothetical protein